MPKAPCVNQPLRRTELIIQGEIAKYEGMGVEQFKEMKKE